MKQHVPWKRLFGITFSNGRKYSGDREFVYCRSFNKANENEVTEPKCTDVIAMDFSINGEKFSLETGTIKEYERTLNIKLRTKTKNF